MQWSLSRMLAVAFITGGLVVGIIPASVSSAPVAPHGPSVGGASGFSNGMRIPAAAPDPAATVDHIGSTVDSIASPAQSITGSAQSIGASQSAGTSDTTAHSVGVSTRQLGDSNISGNVPLRSDINSKLRRDVERRPAAAAAKPPATTDANGIASRVVSTHPRTVEVIQTNTALKPAY